MTGGLDPMRLADTDDMAMLVPRDKSFKYSVFSGAENTIRQIMQTQRLLPIQMGNGTTTRPPVV